LYIKILNYLLCYWQSFCNCWNHHTDHCHSLLEPPDWSLS
jgi:hypothetical protein